MSQIPITIQLE